MRLQTLLACLCLSVALPEASLAQPAPAPKANPVPAPDAATLKIAREVVMQMQGDRTAVLNTMGAPMVGLMQQMGVKEPDRAQVLVQEVVIPVLTAHYDELLDIQARGYASVLGKEDLQAVGAFYASPAGRRLAVAQPQLAQAQMSGMSQWMQSVMPDMQGKIVQAIKAHGWGPGGAAKPK
ncbi:DUF2059 domain-containing protein [Methylobacterium trifolii]|uniref:DUF2059 domain-containing protein n=1 Tax=Methylobacterium trifolii TaxID=1003092 RepID=A0ABQ4U6B8_9HYPH|nr:DUF2059 domain-containing protein [Methylobacterium trifolii]GJE62717.1 hypothetical protein MPOCJGCO_4852 [Methylobacterium trifolii]